MRTWAALLGVLIAALVAPAAASANSKIVYVCGVNLCKVDVDSGAQTQLTNDGTADSPYRSPSLTPGGDKLAFGRGPSGFPYPDLFVANGDGGEVTGPIQDPMGEKLTGYRVVMKPDGSQLGYLHIRTCAHPTIGTCFEPSSAGLDGSGAGPWVTSQTGNTDVGWGPDGLLSSDTGADRQFICLLLPPGGENDGCSRAVATYPGYDLSVPSVSPDGTLVVAEYGCFGGGCSAGTGIALFNYADGSLIAPLTAGDDHHPVFSPDGSFVAFDRGGDIWAVGQPGSEQKIISGGTEPAWGSAAAVPDGGNGGQNGGGQRACVVPKVVGKKLAKARTAIKKAGCKVGSVKRKKAAKRKRGLVLRQSPRAGRHVKLGTKVALVIGRR